ncbi:unnamed protein product [Closterium sp. Naga37s-1]|nr:unnamed protein product [Closterium sp. Naga37s-1]
MRRRLERVQGGPAMSSPNKIPHVAGENSESGTWSAWGLSPREWGEVQSVLRAETPSASQESGQQTSAARRSRGPDEGCGTQASPPARADIRSASARAGESPGRGPRRRGDRWSPQCGRESAPRSPGPASPPPQTCSRRGRGQDPAGDHYRHALHHCAGPAGPLNLPSADAGGSARGDPNPSDAQTTPSPASPEIAAESVARGIALGVSAGLPGHEEMGSEESDGLQGTADRQRRPADPRDALGSGGEEIAAAATDAAATARVPDAADQQVGSMQSERGPTSTPAGGAEERVEEEETARAPGEGQAQTPRGAQQREDGEQRAPELGAGQDVRSPQYSPARGRDPRLGPLRRSTEPRTPAGRQRRGRGSTSAPQPARRGAAAGTTPRGSRVAGGGRRGRRRGGVTVQRRGASSFARAAHRILRGRAGDGENSSDENSVGDPLFNPEREGSSSPSPQVDEAEQHEELDRNPTHSRGASAI